MCWYPVAMRTATVRIAVLALVAGFAIAVPALADVADESASAGSAVSPGAYTPSDGADLLHVLQTQRAVTSTDDVSDAAAALAPRDVAPLENGPLTLDPLSLEPESKRFEAWDLKGGAVVPEPVTALLMGAGLAALAVLRGRRGGTDTE